MIVFFIAESKLGIPCWLIMTGGSQREARTSIRPTSHINCHQIVATLASWSILWKMNRYATKLWHISGLASRMKKLNVSLISMNVGNFVHALHSAAPVVSGATNCGASLQASSLKQHECRKMIPLGHRRPDLKQVTRQQIATQTRHPWG